MQGRFHRFRSQDFELTLLSQEYHNKITVDLLVLMISDVGLLFVFLALCLAVRTVPVDEDDKGKDKHTVWNEDGVQDCCQSLGLVIRGNDNPRVHSGVVTGEGCLVLKEDNFHKLR